MNRMAEKPRKEAMRLRSEQEVGPRRGSDEAAVSLRHRQAEEGGKGIWNAVEHESRLSNRWSTRIARETFFPGEPIMGALRTGEDRRRAGLENWGRDLHRHIHPLASKQLDTGPTMLSPAPILPEQGSRANIERMKQQTHSARMLGGLPMPLTLLTQATRTAGTDAGLIDDAQTPIGFPASFLRKEARSSRTAQHAVRLEGKVLPREAARFPG
jgi:hypothetical protein